MLSSLVVALCSAQCDISTHTPRAINANVRAWSCEHTGFLTHSCGNPAQSITWRPALCTAPKFSTACDVGMKHAARYDRNNPSVYGNYDDAESECNGTT